MQQAMTVARRLLEAALAHTNDPDQPPPKGSHFAPDAQKHVDTWRKSLDERTRSNELEGQSAFRAHLSKSGAFGMRLALLLHAIAEVSGDTSEHVTLDTARAATKTADYFIGQAEVMYGLHQEPDLDLAKRLLKRLQNGDFPDGVKTAVIQQSTKNLKLDALLSALSLLEQHGYVRVVEIPNAGARSSRIVNINPALYSITPTNEEAQLPS